MAELTWVVRRCLCGSNQTKESSSGNEWEPWPSEQTTNQHVSISGCWRGTRSRYSCVWLKGPLERTSVLIEETVDSSSQKHQCSHQLRPGWPTALWLGGHEAMHWIGTSVRGLLIGWSLRLKSHGCTLSTAQVKVKTQEPESGRCQMSLMCLWFHMCWQILINQKPPYSVHTLDPSPSHLVWHCLELVPFVLCSDCPHLSPQLLEADAGGAGDLLVASPLPLPVSLGVALPQAPSGLAFFLMLVDPDFNEVHEQKAPLLLECVFKLRLLMTQDDSGFSLFLTQISS